jgi:putative DNA primase/helicase
MPKPVPRLAQRKTPHVTAKNFKADQRPTLIEYEEEFLAYDDAGAYRVIKNRTVKSEVQSYLEDAQEMRPTPPNGTKKAFDFNPKKADVEEIYAALEKQNHVAPGTIAPPFFLPGDWAIDYRTFLTDPRDVISCRNGLLQISTGELYGSTAQFFTRSALPIDFDPDALCPLWLKFLEEVFEGNVELILLVQQMFGYLLTSDTSHQKIFYFNGVPGSGKSTIMRVLDALIGEKNICNPSIADLAERSTLNDMTGSTLAKITDMNTSNVVHLSEAASNMNRISGGDPVHVFRKFKEGINVKMGVRFLMAGNTFPNFGQYANALRRRLLVIPFNKSFEDNPDTELSDKLIAELPGILNWALEGLISLRTAGKFIEPAASLDAKADILNSGDPVRSFVADECDLSPALSVNKDVAFARYLQHCAANGVKMPLTKENFVRSLKTAFNGVRPARPRTDATDSGREHTLNGIGLKNAVPTITFKLDPFWLDLGVDRLDPQAILRNADGRPVEYVTSDFDE